MSPGTKNTILVIGLVFVFLLILICNPFPTYVNECDQMKCKLYLIFADCHVVKERFGADVPHIAARCCLACLLDMGLDAPERRGKTPLCKTVRFI